MADLVRAARDPRIGAPLAQRDPMYARGQSPWYSLVASGMSPGSLPAEESVDSGEEGGDLVIGSPVEKRLVGILFADIAKYSTLSEPQLCAFAERVLPRIANLISETAGLKPIELNSWGDAIHLASTDLHALARFALTLRDYFRRHNWQDDHLPNDLSIRIALHAAHAFWGHDPLRARDGIVGGQNVSLAARIEPVTPAGHVWTTSSFREVFVKGGDPKIEFDDLGDRQLAKKYGAERLFNLRWKDEEPFSPKRLASLDQSEDQPDDSRPPEEFFDLGLRDSGASLSICTASSSPTVDAYLRIANLSSHAARLTKLLWRVHADQFFLEGETGREVLLPPRRVVETASFSKELGDAQVAAAGLLRHDSRAQLQLEAYVDWKGSIIQVRKVVSDIHPRLVLRPARCYVIGPHELIFEVELRQGELRWDRGLLLCPKCIELGRVSQFNLGGDGMGDVDHLWCRSCGLRRQIEEEPKHVVEDLALQFAHKQLQVFASPLEITDLMKKGRHTR